MKFECNKTKLSEAVNNVQRAVASKSVKPVLEGILVKAQNGSIQLTGYNLEICITTSIDARIYEEGSDVITAKLFSDIIRKMPEDSITLKTDEKHIVYISSGNSEYKIIGMPSSDYPEIPVIRSTDVIKIDSETLSSMIRQTIYAVSETDVKPSYTGCLFEIADKTFRMVALDGIRLAIRTEKIDYDQEKSFIVPGKSLSEVIKLTVPGKEDEQIEIISSGRHIIFRIGSYSLISRLIEAEFINYRSAIPSSHVTEVRVNTRHFINTIERMSLMLTDKMKNPIRCIIDNNSIKTICNTPVGQAHDEISVQTEGEPIEIGFNNKYLLDALRYSETDEVILLLSGPVKPMIIKPTEGDSFLFIVVPMRLSK